MRYTQTNRITQSPRELFLADFIHQLQQWQATGDHLLIFADMNEHVLTGPLTQRLLSLGLEEAAHKSWGNLEPHTYIDGTRPIDAVYHSPEIKITATMQLSFHKGVGDHRTVLVDVSSRSLIGKYDFKMLVRPIAQRLTTSNSSAMKCYIHYIEREVKARNLHSQLCDISLALSTNSHDSSAL